MSLRRQFFAALLASQQRYVCRFPANPLPSSTNLSTSSNPLPGQSSLGISFRIRHEGFVNKPNYTQGESRQTLVFLTDQNNSAAYLELFNNAGVPTLRFRSTAANAFVGTWPVPQITVGVTRTVDLLYDLPALTLRLEIDGAQVGATTTIPQALSDARNVALGYFVGNQSVRAFAGDLDEVRIRLSAVPAGAGDDTWTRDNRELADISSYACGWSFEDVVVAGSIAYLDSTGKGHSLVSTSNVSTRTLLNTPF